jgi:hypothetical protein
VIVFEHQVFWIFIVLAKISRVVDLAVELSQEKIVKRAPLTLE